jgi:hypothetical protein
VAEIGPIGAALPRLPAGTAVGAVVDLGEVTPRRKK